MRYHGERLPTFVFGADGISNQNSTPRVVFVPTTEIIGDSIAQAGFGEGVKSPSSICARKSQIELRIWGKDFDECEEIMRHVVNALRNIAWGGDRNLSVDWTRNQSANAKAGILCVLLCSIEIPIQREEDTTVTLTDFTPLTGQFVTS
jgi:hypothetical protein